MPEPNGRLKFRKMDFIKVFTMIFLIGGSWAVLGYKVKLNAEDIEGNKTSVEANDEKDHKRDNEITEIKGDIKYIKEDVKEIRSAQKEYTVKQIEQTALLHTILANQKND